MAMAVADLSKMFSNMREHLVDVVIAFPSGKIIQTTATVEKLQNGGNTVFDIAKQETMDITLEITSAPILIYENLEELKKNKRRFVSTEEEVWEALR